MVLAFTSFVLVVAEFLPPSMLPAMAASLGVSEGQAGQTVTATALVGLLTAPTIGLIFPGLDRRTLLAGLTLSAAVSNILVAIAPNLWLMLLARLLLGAAIGGFWALSLAVAAQLARERHLGRAIMLINTGTSVATVAGVPLGIYLGEIFDWRVVFVIASAVSVAVALSLRLILPAVAPARATGLSELREVLRSKGIALGLVGHLLTVIAHFTAFSYIRPALEKVPGVGTGGAAMLVVLFGAGSIAGNFAVGMIVDRHLRTLSYAVPALMAAGIAVLAAAPGQVPVAAAVVVWGATFGAWVIVVTTWMGRVSADRMEAGGGLLVAGFQLAALLGAGVGGLLVDALNIEATLLLAVASAAIGGVLFGTAVGRRAEAHPLTLVVAIPDEAVAD